MSGSNQSKAKMNNGVIRMDINIKSTNVSTMLLTIAFAPCQLVRQHGEFTSVKWMSLIDPYKPIADFKTSIASIVFLKITGILLKDGNPVPFTSKTELENNESTRYVEDVCIKLRASITSNTGVPYDTVGCIFCSLIAHPKQNHVIVNIENKGSVEVDNFVNGLYSVYERRRHDTYNPALKLRRHFAIRIAMGIVGDDLTGEWRSVYGSATEVLDIAETACLKYERMANTVNLPGYKNFTCVVTGPDRGYLKGEFILQLESDELDTNMFTKLDLEKRNTGIGYDLVNLQFLVLIAARYNG